MYPEHLRERCETGDGLSEQNKETVEALEKVVQNSAFVYFKRKTLADLEVDAVKRIGPANEASLGSRLSFDHWKLIPAAEHEVLS